MNKLLSFSKWLARMPEMRWKLTLSAIALLVSAVWTAWIFPREIRFDERDYVGHAQRLVEGKGYVDEDGAPAAYWPVGYPLLLAGSYAAFGEGKLVGIALQILLSVGTCLVVSGIGSSAFGPAVGRTAALMLALYPNHVYYSTLLLTEPLFTLLFVAAIWWMLKSLQSTGAAVAAGLALGLGLLVRPAALLLPGFLFFWYWRQASPRRAVLLTVLLGTASLAAIAPWLARNHELTRKWTVLSTTGGHNFWIGNYPGSFGGYARSQKAMQELVVDGRLDYERGYRLGMESILSDPVEAGVRTFRKATYFFALETDGALWNLKGLPGRPSTLVTVALVGLANAAYVGVVALSVLGLLRTRLTDPLGSLFLVTTVYFLLISLVFVGDPRYHYSLLPIAIIFAAKALVEDVPGLLKAENRRLLVLWASIAAGFLILMAANVGIKAAEVRA